MAPPPASNHVMGDPAVVKDFQKRNLTHAAQVSAAECTTQAPKNPNY
jgi:hypothetical protein